MALKKYIVKQVTNWNGRGEKVGTSIVQMDESEIASYVSMLDGEVEVFEQDLTLSVSGSTATTSLNIADFIKIRHDIHKPIYISNSNKRPIVFKTNLDTVIANLKAVKPFPAPYAADLPIDVSIDTGNHNLL